MCGFAGFIGNRLGGADLLRRMGQALAHRGPDGSGIWLNTSEYVGMVHRRLSIVDLSQAGDQPMHSISGRFTLAFNGEIYNHLDLRAELNKIFGLEIFSWRGHSDTETLLSCIEMWGLEKTLQKTIGMFALALWDADGKRLFLARDRFGEKPLYYGWQGNGVARSFIFGSELKALTVHPSFSSKVNRGSLSLLLRHNCIPAPYTIYEGISKLEPGSILTVTWSNSEPKISKYWDAVEVASAKRAAPFTGSPKESVDELESLVKSAVTMQMMGDVPLGAFLSGGVDSSTVVSLMQAQSHNPVKTFTIGFNEAGFNEAIHAKAIAKHLGTDHTELYITPNQAIDVIPKLPSLFSEPFADSSQIPTYLVSLLASQKVTVSLSGDAGDELFCGYNRYKFTSQLWAKISRVPVPIRDYASQLITSIPPNAWDKLGRILATKKNYIHLGDKIHKGAGVLASADFRELYLGMVSQVSDPGEWVIGGFEPPTKLIGNAPVLDEFNIIEQMMLLDVVSYLPDDILVKVDRAAMGVSLEGRVPFLDHRIFEFAWSLPLSFKFRDGQTKWPLRQLLYRYVPKELFERPKMGFAVPIGDWLRGPLRDWAETLLSEERLRREGYFHPKVIRSKWAEHLSGRRNWQSQLWTILMFQAWLENDK